MAFEPTIVDSLPNGIGSVALKKAVFSTGSLGYRGNGQFEWEGRRYQTNITVTEMGTQDAERAATVKAEKEAKNQAEAERLQKRLAYLTGQK